MNQYPKWFLALTFPNILIPFVTMIFLMFGGVHPFGDVDSMFWSFMIYIINQLFWLLPAALFFISLFCWANIREKMAIGTAIAGWVVNIGAILSIVTA